MKFLYFLNILFICCICHFSANAQLNITPNPVVIMDLDVTEYDIIAHSLIQNESNETKTFTWVRNVISIHPDWSSAVCDKNQCYLPHVSAAPLTFELEPQEQATLDVHVYPFENEGAAIIEVIVTDVNDPENVITGSYYFNESPSSNKERINNNIKFFPNPAMDYITIDNFDGLSKVEIYSLDGKMIINNVLQSDNKVDISTLTQGAYILRMKDNQGRQLSSNVLMKN